MYNRIVFGNLKINYTCKFNDITKREFLVLLPLFMFIIIGGIKPSVFTDFVALEITELFFISRDFMS